MSEPTPPTAGDSDPAMEHGRGSGRDTAGRDYAERLERLQLAIMHELETRGVAIVSNAPMPDGRTALRACVVNFRTRPEDMEALATASLEIGEELAASTGF